MVGDNVSFSSFDFSNETEFENILVKKNILKNFLVIDAKKTLNFVKNYNRYADVLLIQKDYKYWSIGEVEIAEHSFKSHVFPQLVEIAFLVDKNIRYIRENFLKIENVPSSKEVQDLINFNKPFITLVIDKFPSKYSNILPLLSTFCNVITVIRLRDDNENYAYIEDFYKIRPIDEIFTYLYIENNIASIDHPNLLGLDKFNYFEASYEEEKISFGLQQPVEVDGERVLFWLVNNTILRNGKYVLKKKNLNYCVQKIRK